MSPLFLFGLFLLIFFTISTHSLTINNFEIRDLEDTTSFLETEATPWQINTNLTSMKTTQCFGTYLLGGYGIVNRGGSFFREYTDLPPHNIIYFSLYFWILDLEEARNLFDIYFDNQLVGTWDTANYDYSSFNFGSICGGSKKDYPYISVKGKFPHSSNSLLLKIVMLFNDMTDTFWFGFRDLRLLFQNSTSSPSASSCQFTDSRSADPSCFCLSGYYDPPGSTSCSTCNSNCYFCVGPSATDCASCESGYSLFGTQCTQCHPSCSQCNGALSTDCIRCPSNKFLYWNGTCQSSCNSPFIPKTEGIYSSCLPCASSQFLYKNGSCEDNCTSPFVQDLQGGIKYCNFPCSSSTPILYWNGTCQSSCNSPHVPKIDGIYTYCLPCSGSEFLYQNGSCNTNCTSPFVQDIQEDIKYCNFACSSSAPILYWDGTCQGSCDFPLVTKTEGIYTYCLPCSTSEFLYQNGTCMENCSSPFLPNTLDNVKYCNFSCSSALFLYSDGSCIADCPPSFQEVIDSNKYCKFHCPLDQYLYWNQTCQPSCLTPLKPIRNAELYQFCNLPCNDGEYLYPNGSCFNSCNFSIEASIDGVNMCEYPCEVNEFLFQDLTCMENCLPPYREIQVDDYLSLCNSPCNLNEFYYEPNGNCIQTCTPPLTNTTNGLINVCNDPVPANISQTSSNYSSSLASFAGNVAAGAALVGGVIRPSNTNSVFMISLAKLVKYVRYLQINLPYNVRQVFHTQNSSAFSISTTFSFKMPQYIKEAYPMRPLPEAFANENIHSSYLVNEWEALSTFLIVFSLGLFFGILERFIKRTRHKMIILITRRLRLLTHWNFVLFLIFNSYDDLTFFFILELRTLHLGSFAAFVSLFVAITITFVALYLLFKAWQVTKQYYSMKSKVRDALSINEDTFYKKWERYQVIYSGFKEDSRLKQSCLFIMTTRVLLCYIIVACLYEKPVIQTVLFTIFSILMISYMVGLRPIVDKFNFIVVMVYEILILIVNICVMIVANLDAWETSASGIRDGLGQTIIIANSIIDFCSNAFMWMYILLGLRASYHIQKTPGPYRKTIWFNMIVVPYQNPGMDFNVLSNNEIESLSLNASPDLQILALSQPQQNKSHYKQLEQLGTIPTDPDEDKNAYKQKRTDTMETISSGGEENDNRKLMKGPGPFSRILPIKRRITLKRLQVSDDPDSESSTPRNQAEILTSQKSIRTIYSKNTLPLKVPSIIVEEPSPLEKRRKESSDSRIEDSRRSPNDIPDIFHAPELLSSENDESSLPNNRIHFVSVLDRSGTGLEKDKAESLYFSPSPRMPEETPRENSRLLQVIHPVEIQSLWNKHPGNEMNRSPRSSRNDDSKLDTVCFEEQDNLKSGRPLISQPKSEQKAFRKLKRAFLQEKKKSFEPLDTSMKNSKISIENTQPTEDQINEKPKARLSRDIKSLIFGAVVAPIRKSTFQKSTNIVKHTLTQDQLSPDSSPNRRATLSQVYVSSINLKEASDEPTLKSLKSQKVISKESLH